MPQLPHHGGRTLVCSQCPRGLQWDMVGGDWLDKAPFHGSLCFPVLHLHSLPEFPGLTCQINYLTVFLSQGLLLGNPKEECEPKLVLIIVMSTIRSLTWPRSRALILLNNHTHKHHTTDHGPHLDPLLPWKLPCLSTNTSGSNSSDQPTEATGKRPEGCQVFPE